MILPDVNVLIYAFRHDSARHIVCKAWLDQTISADARFGISPMALSGVVRITTHPRIFENPSALDDAFGFCHDLLSQPHCEIVQPGERHWGIFERLCVQANITGARVTDAWFAALAIEHGCTWITYDRDYARFSGLDWKRPAT
jgi:toxin-antitoxin system PIN domain toxin